MSAPLRHSESVMARFGRTADGCLEVGGMPLTALAQRVGDTPFFAYSRALITQRVGDLRAVLPSDIHLSFAVKANPMPALVQHMAGLVDGFDIASAAEMKIVLDTPVRPDRVSFAGPGKTTRELTQAVAAGIVIYVESRGEMRRIADVAGQLGMRPRVAIRVNPNFEPRASGMQMGGGPKPFGVDAELVPEMLGELAGLGLDFEGFHVFAGSQNLSAASLADAQQHTIELALALSELVRAPIRMLNIGGGFGIPYFPGDQPLDLETVGDNLERAVRRLRSSVLETRVVLELGRYLVGEAGVYVCRVVDRKVSRGKLYLVTDGGLHHHLAASGNFGQVVRRNYPIAIGNKMGRADVETADIVGCLCTPIDVLGRSVLVPESDVGDLVVVFQSGAYGPSASPTGFLSHPAPVEVLV